MTMSARTKIYLLISIYLVILLVMGFFSYFLILKLDAKSGEYLGAKGEIFKIDRKRDLLKESQSILLSFKQDIENLGKAFLNNEEIPGFIETLEKIAASSNVIFSIEYVPAAKGLEGSELNFKISLFGSFSNTLRFLANLENVPFAPYRLVKVKNLNLKRIETTDLRFKKFQDLGVKEGMIDASIDMAVYLSK